MVWLENSLNQSEGGGRGRGGSEERNRLWRARTPSGGHSKYVREKQCCRGEEGKPWDGRG